MFFTVKKLDELEKIVQKNLMTADNHHWDMPHKPYWINYRQDMPKCLMVIREFRDIVAAIEKEKAENIKKNTRKKQKNS